MEIKRELFEQAKGCKSAEEILSLAKSNGIEMSGEQAKQAFDKLGSAGSMGGISDDELANVSGGNCSPDDKAFPIYIPF